MKYFVFLCVFVIGANAICDDADGVGVVCEVCTEDMVCSLDAVQVTCSRDPCDNCSVVWADVDGVHFTAECLADDDVTDDIGDVDADIDIDDEVDYVDEDDDEGPMNTGNRKWRRKYGRLSRKRSRKFEKKQWKQQRKTITPDARLVAIQKRRQDMTARWVAKGKKEKEEKFQRKWDTKDERKAGRLDIVKKWTEHFQAMTPEQRVAFLERQAQRQQWKQKRKNTKWQKAQRRQGRKYATMVEE